jgi:hypothetical protein
MRWFIRAVLVSLASRLIWRGLFKRRKHGDSDWTV